MTSNPCAIVTASGSDHPVPIGIMIAATQPAAPSLSMQEFSGQESSGQELSGRCAALEQANRFLSQEAKRAAEFARFQLTEVEHRLMNTFATVQALVMQSAQPGDTGEAFRAVFGARLLALARSNEFLGSRYPKGAPLDLIVTRCLAPFDDMPSRITTTGPRVYLRARDVLPIGLALHELTTNAVKHGALSASEGRVEVNWRLEVRRADRARSVVITWRERGGPLVTPPNRRGFGSRLLERGLSQSPGSGTAQLDFAPHGVDCRIWLPLSNSRNRTES